MPNIKFQHTKDTLYLIYTGKLWGVYSAILKKIDWVTIVMKLIVWKNFTQTSWPIQQQLYLLTSTRQTKNIFIDLWHRTQLYHILL